MVTFLVPKMKCNGCVQSVTNALHKIDEAAAVDIDLDKKQVRFESGVPQEDALKALVAAGYPATIVQ
ncbi:heavy-metal-associated domain-containing protein [Brucella gallinifaecis]|uniref:Heavy-metal-associated domain-containing protein n=1 Tax=Brucella gallinifaecis TaxID=215590 RepID=A0A502BQC3_9HYPH|nr:heavy-metal-associated domain-containing protein [Brucella gallinifaecis]TPF75243.1 heavy-metal-associated domain-containing protein [Brucella gallinifaecis]